jgi:hypothetical protein
MTKNSGKHTAPIEIEFTRGRLGWDINRRRAGEVPIANTSRSAIRDILRA